MSSTCTSGKLIDIVTTIFLGLFGSISAIKLLKITFQSLYVYPSLLEQLVEVRSLMTATDTARAELLASRSTDKERGSILRSGLLKLSVQHGICVSGW